MKRQILAVLLIAVMLCMTCRVTFADGAVMIAMSAEINGGKYFINNPEGGRDKVSVENAVVVSVIAANYEGSDLCSGKFSITYNEDEVSVAGYKSTVGSWDVNDLTPGVLTAGFARTDEIESGILFSAAFEPKDADAVLTFGITIEEMLSGDIAAGNPPVEYVLVSDTIEFTPSEEQNPEPPTEDVIKGDANGDGKVNTSDATTILKHSAEIEFIPDAKLLMQADANGDGKVNTSDATEILKYVAGIIEL